MQFFNFEPLISFLSFIFSFHQLWCTSFDHSGTFDWKLYCSKNDTWNWKGIMILCINNILEISVLFYCRGFSVFFFFLFGKVELSKFPELKSSTRCNCLYKLYTNHDLWFIKNSPFSDFQIGRSFFLTLFHQMFH